MQWEFKRVSFAVDNLAVNESTHFREESFQSTTRTATDNQTKTRICAAEMAVRYAALSACRKVHVCHCNSLGGAT